VIIVDERNIMKKAGSIIKEKYVVIVEYRVMERFAKNVSIDYIN